METIRTFSLTVKVAFAVVCIGWVGSAQAALSISDTPLFLGGAVAPNIMYTLDDSGSMDREVMPTVGHEATTRSLYPRPDDTYGTTNGENDNKTITFNDNDLHHYTRRSLATNSIFYNPDIDYEPWSNSDASLMSNANPSCVLHHPMRPALGCFDILQQQTATLRWFENISGDGNLNNAQNSCNPADNNATCAKSFYTITYFIYNGAVGNMTDIVNFANYTKVQITSATPTSNTYTSPMGIVRTRDQEVQNFANWYQYYRSRDLTARAGTGKVFSQQGTSLRIGFARLGPNTKNIDGVNNNAVDLGVRPFTGADRTTWFNRLYNSAVDGSGGTPLRRAMGDVGEYFSRSDNQGPWGEVPGTNNTTAHSECRQSYHILMTDGDWGGNPAGNASAQLNVDNSTGPSITNHAGGPNYQYTAANPYSDSFSNTLADVAMYYWNHDLRTDLLNKVPTNPSDPAFWQHVAQFTVGLGVFGTLDPLIDLPALTAGTLSWPDPSLGPLERIDDLWHSAVNGRGQFLTATNPLSFASGLGSTLQSIADRTSSAAAVALNSGTITTTSQLYQARFDSGDWSGQLLAFPINPDATLGPQAWDAGAVVSGQNFDTGRKIITYKPSTGAGIPFRWPSNPSSPSSSELDVSQSAALDINPSTGTADGLGSARLNYLRGDTSNATFRIRTSVFGDVINSAPVFVGAPNLPYPDMWGASAPENSAPYSSSFKNNTTYVNRTPMVYAAANDGMLHGFRTSDGTETIAYVPSKTFANLNRLTDPAYNHRFYVDGPVNIVDAYLGTTLGWRSVLAGSMGAGGQGVYALDVSVPPGSGGGAESSITNKVLWEFTDTDDLDLGRTFSMVNIVRMHNGKWAGVFGNGYNNTEADGAASTTGNAVLYIVDLETGALIRKLDTGEGTADDPTGSGRPNGLATPAVIDIDGDFIADYIYAGDLFGNLWKFDVTDTTNPSNWDVAYGGQPLFTAVDANGDAQPITTTPQVGIHPLGISQGFVVYFGTGKFFENGDNTQTGQVTQSFYGVWDKNLATLTAFTRAHLLQQQILQEVTSGGFDLRAASDNQVVWHSASGTPSGTPPTTHLGWYMDLYNTEGGNTNNFGERQVSNAVLRNDRIIFTTLIPSSNDCDFGGTGWLMELDPTDGSRIDFVIFDINNDGVFDDNDMIQVAFDVDGDGDVDSDDKLPPSGKKSTVGIIPTVSIIKKPGGGGECINGIMVKYASGSMGAIEATANNCGPEVFGRQTWRQLDR